MTTINSGLTSKQRAHLRKLAHHAKPSIHIGKGGVNGATVHAVEEAFSTEELLKVKILEAAPAPVRDVAEQLATAISGVSVVQVMGRIATLYRPHPDTPKIVLPSNRAAR